MNSQHRFASPSTRACLAIFLFGVLPLAACDRSNSVGKVGDASAGNTAAGGATETVPPGETSAAGAAGTVAGGTTGTASTTDSGPLSTGGIANTSAVMATGGVTGAGGTRTAGGGAGGGAAADGGPGAGGILDAGATWAQGGDPGSGGTGGAGGTGGVGGRAGIDGGGTSTCDCAGGETTWDCFCGSPNACDVTLSSFIPDAGSNRYSELEEYAACGLVVVTSRNSAMGVDMYVFDRTSGRLVGKKSTSDTPDRCPFQAGPPVMTLSAGQFPDSTCVRSKCLSNGSLLPLVKPCSDGGV
jgi:hypothetical protein